MDNQEDMDMLFDKAFIQEFLDAGMSSSSSSDEEFEAFFDDYPQCGNYRIPRVPDYVETVVSRYTDEEFQETFR